MKCAIVAAVFAWCGAATSMCAAAGVEDYYTIEDIATPPGIKAEVGGLAFTPSGKLAVCFQSGEVMLYDPATKAWSAFAEGLHEPLGIVALSEHDVVVMQRPELTRLIDTDGDGVADEYRTVSDDFGLTGNYHEFAFGPLVDADGNFIVALNTASTGAGVRYEVRGERNPLGDHGRMYSYVPWRGWVVAITPDGKLTPLASGFRSPNGLGFDAAGRLFVTDNQGDWIGTSPLYHVEQGKHYGHAASLVWRDGWSDGDPLKLPVAKLDAMRTKPSVQFPHGAMANSPTQPIAVTGETAGAFKAFAGQMIVGEMNQPRLIRLMLEEVGGAMQGACVPLIDRGKLRAGNNRLAWGPDGSLWVGRARHAWAGANGIQRITPTGKTPLDVATMSLIADGFELTFTRPVDAKAASNPDAYRFQRYYYEYHAAYGSKQFDVKAVKVAKAAVSGDGLRVTLTLDEPLKAGYLYDLHLTGIATADGEPLLNTYLVYTANRLRGDNAP